MTGPEKLKQAQERLDQTYRKRPSAAQSTGRTSVHLSSGLRCKVEQGGWTMTADQPESMGGGNEGPDPGFFGRAALGVCAAQGYAIAFAQHGIAFRSLNVEIESDIDSRGSLAIEPSVPPGYQRVRCLVSIESDADEAEILAALDHVDRTSPWRYNFTTALEVTRQVTIKNS